MPSFLLRTSERPPHRAPHPPKLIRIFTGWFTWGLNKFLKIAKNIFFGRGWFSDFMLVFGGVICPYVSSYKNMSICLVERDRWYVVENFEITTSFFLQGQGEGMKHRKKWEATIRPLDDHVMSLNELVSYECVKDEERDWSVPVHLENHVGSMVLHF